MPRAKVFKFVLIAFILGIVAGRWLNLPSDAWISLIAAAAWIIIFIRSAKAKIISLIILFFIFGALRYQLSWPTFGPNRLEFYNGQKTIFTGRVIRETMNNTDKRLVLEVNSINNDVGAGRALIKVPLYSTHGQGQNLSVACKIVAPQNYSSFNYVGYLAKDAIFSVCYYPDSVEVIGGPVKAGWLTAFRNNAQALINQNFSEPQGALLSSLLLGARQSLPQEFRDQLGLTGTSHLVAIAGLHVLIMIMLTEMILFSVFGLKRKYAFYATVAVVISFVFLTGGAAPTIRAGIMGILLLYAKKIGRLYQSGNVVFLVAAMMLVVNPLLIFWDVGFQLSFLAVLGLVYLSPMAEKLLRRVPDWRWCPLRSSLVITCSAYLVTLPLILYYFGNLSLVSPLVNALILGVLPWAMMLGFIFILLGLAWVVAAKILLWPC
ncbi:MAG: ComEC/Rec2 family competence protein, partial [Candidatus Parcubacteria bacterium]|nr:ComEC/Rec2 family competence protein [Candidatus Parcubacteria bacterium]